MAVVVIVLLAAIAGSGMMMWFFGTFQTRMKQLERGGDADRLAEQIEALRHELLAVRDDVGELYERIEFAERLLTRGRSDDAT